MHEEDAPVNGEKGMVATKIQRRRDDKNKICGFKGGEGRRGAERKNRPKRYVFFFFRGKRHDNKILNVQILLSRNFVVVAQAPIDGSSGRESQKKGSIGKCRTFWCATQVPQRVGCPVAKGIVSHAPTNFRIIQNCLQ